MCELSSTQIAWVLITAIILDAIVLGALLWVKAESDILIVRTTLIGLALVFGAEKWFLKLHDYDEEILITTANKAV